MLLFDDDGNGIYSISTQNIIITLLSSPLFLPIHLTHAKRKKEYSKQTESSRITHKYLFLQFSFFFCFSASEARYVRVHALYINMDPFLSKQMVSDRNVEFGITIFFLRFSSTFYRLQ